MGFGRPCIYIFLFQTSLIISQKSYLVIFHCLVPVCCVGNPWYTSAKFIMSQRPTTKAGNIATSLSTLVARQNKRLDEVQEQLRRGSAIVSRFPVAPLIALFAVFVKPKYYAILLMANYPYSNCNAGNNPKIRFTFLFN